MKRSWTLKRVAIVVVLAIGLAPFNAGADITGGIANGYSDNFDYPDVSLGNNAPLDPAQWQTYPTASNGVPVPNVWVVGGTQTATTVTDPGSEIKALKQQTTGAGASEPVAYVKDGNWQNMIVSVRGAFVGPSQNSGIGIVFRAPVDPLTGLADRNNYYLFTAVQKTADKKDCVTGRCYFLIKRVGGAFFLGAMSHTYLNFVDPTGPSGEAHTYKVVMSGSHIMCYVDNNLVIETTDTPGDDISGMFAMPGPMFANGTVGVRSSNTKAWFDDFLVMGDSPRAYEARAVGLSVYGQVGQGTNGTVASLTAADTNFQYHDHDFPLGNSTEGTFVSPASPTTGMTGGALITTSGKDGVSKATAQLVGYNGTLSTPMPDGTTVDVTLISDSISASATASCEATTTVVKIVNLSYLIVVRNSAGVPIWQQQNSSDGNPPANTVVNDPQGNGGYVRITLNAQKVTIDPKRADVSAIRIDFLQRKFVIGSGTTTFGDTGITTATVHLANVVAGRLCTPVI